jgi:hypothetical protein
MINHTPIVMDWIQPIRRKATARKHDPQVSHDAAAFVELGKAVRQRCRIASALALKPMTVAEMADFLGEPAHELGKRVGEIFGVEPTGEVRGGMRVWRLI